MRQDGTATSLDAADPLSPDTLIRLMHGMVEWYAQRADVRLLHIKGPAAAMHFGVGRGWSSDVDVLVDPCVAERLIAAMTEAGWRILRRASKHRFIHATTLSHESWGPWVDVHHWFPGLDRDPQMSFDALWEDAPQMDLGGWPCRVPARAPGHALLLMVNSARNPASSPGAREGLQIWDGLAPHERQQVHALATRVGADSALAARHSDDFVAHGSAGKYWEVIATNPSPTAMWLARVAATPRWTDKVRVTIAASLPSGVSDSRRVFVAQTAEHWVRGLRSLPGALRAIRLSRRGEL